MSQIFAKKRSRFRFFYEYDFGDGWRHEIVLEETKPAEPTARYPRCIEGARACPPEDCGGPWGYEDFLQAIRDSEHEEHESMLEWIGGQFVAFATPKSITLATGRPSYSATRTFDGLTSR